MNQTKTQLIKNAVAKVDANKISNLRQEYPKSKTLSQLVNCEQRIQGYQAKNKNSLLPWCYLRSKQSRLCQKWRRKKTFISNFNWGIILSLFVFIVSLVLISEEGVRVVNTTTNKTTITYISKGKALAYFIPCWLGFFGLIWLIVKAATGGFSKKGN